MTSLLIIRHGPTDWNAGRRIQGHTDISLSASGKAMVQNWNIPIQYSNYHCWASPLARAQETATILGLSPQTEPALIEMAWGDWEGRILSDIRTELGDEMTQNESRGMDFHPPGGESPRDVQTRLVPWLKTLKSPTIAVSHRGVIRALYALASGWDMTSKPPVRLKKFAAHLYKIDTDGHPHIKRLNIDLEKPS